MKTKLLLLMLIAMTAMTSCEEGVEEILTSAEITLADGTTPSLTISPAGEKKTITFASTQDWTAEVEADKAWCTISPASGDASESVNVTITVEKNETSDERTAKVTIRSDSKATVFTITQKQNDVFSFAGVPTESFGSSESTFEITVSENTGTPTVMIESDKDWVSYKMPTKTKGLTSTAITFTVDANETFDSRTAEITITSGDTEPEKFTITQLKLAAAITLADMADKNIVNIPFSGVKKTVTFSSAFAWTAALSGADAAGFELSAIEGDAGEAVSFEITALANPNNAVKSATVTITSLDAKETITLSQVAYVEDMTKYPMVMGAGTVLPFYVYDRNAGVNVPHPAVVPVALNWTNKVHTEEANPNELAFRGDYYSLTSSKADGVCAEGWRLPTAAEFKIIAPGSAGLATALIKHLNGVAILTGSNDKTCYFPLAGSNTNPNANYTFYYTSTTDVMFVSSDNNYVTKISGSGQYPVRCVKSVDYVEDMSKYPLITDATNGDFYVYDRNAGVGVPHPYEVPVALNWVNKVHTEEANPNEFLFKGDYYTIAEATDKGAPMCAEGWRVPTREELTLIGTEIGFSNDIVTLTGSNDKISYFPVAGNSAFYDNIYGAYWSGTQTDEGLYRMSFTKGGNLGYHYISNPVYHYSVRCVKSK